VSQLKQVRRRRIVDVSAGIWIVLGLVGVAGLSSALAFSGWVFGLGRLTTFGLSARPMWPWTGIGFMFLAGGFWATYMWHRSAPWLLAVPLILGGCFLVEQALGLQGGIEWLLFPDAVAGFPDPGAGRSAPNAIASFLFLGTALLMVRHRSHASVELANLLASASLCFGLFSLIPLVSVVARSDPMTRIFVAPLPVDLASLALSVAFLVWRQEAGWTLLQSATRLQRPLVNALLPLAFILPALPSFTARWGAEQALRAPVINEMLAVLLNVAIIGLLIWIAVNRISRQGAALRDVTLALDSAAIALTDENGVITHWSRGCQELYKWTATQAVGRKKYELMNSRCEKAGANDLPGAPEYSEIELIERRRDGSEISVLERRQLFVRANQEPLVVLRIIDISQRVQAEAQLRASQTRFATAVEAHQLGVTEWDIASGRLHWTPGSEQRLGLTTGSLPTIDDWEALVYPEDRDTVFATIAAATADTADRCEFHYRFRRPDGQERMVAGSARLFYDGRGDLVTVVGANSDITERNERAAALQAREAQLRSVLETVPDALIVIAEGGEIRTFSAAAERMFGYEAALTIGRNASFLLPDAPDRAEGTVIDYLTDHFRSAAGNTRELVARHADGSFFPLELNVGEARLGEDRVFTIVARNVADRHAVERRLTDLGAELAHVARQSAMSELAADLAHELNQPLSATSNFLAAARMVIESGQDTDRVPELLRMGEEQMHRSGEIIRRLRDFLVKRDVEMRAESLNHVVREAVELVLFGAAQTDVRVVYELDSSSDMVFVDRIQVQQVLVNLLRNAIQVLRAQPLSERDIIIGSRRDDGGMVEVSVEDTGPGLPADLHEKLGTRFATTKGAESMGVGLSISRRIIEAHGGTLVAGKRAVGGAVFRFTLPEYEELVE